MSDLLKARGYISGADFTNGMPDLSKEVLGDIQSLDRLGIGLDSAKVDQMIAFACDSIQGLGTTPSIPTPVQYLQTIMAGHVGTAYAVRKIDEITGLTTTGRFFDKQIVQSSLEVTGGVAPYGDYVNTSFSGWNQNFEARDVVVMENGLRVGFMEEKVSGETQVNASDAKRRGCSVALDISRNSIGFVGYNNGSNRTYGFLNDPSLPSYVTVATGTGGDTKWSTKTYDEITADIREMASSIRKTSKGVVNVRSMATTLVLPQSAIDYLSIQNPLGATSVEYWIKTTYPKMRIVDAPELDGADGGENVMYLFADKIEDGTSTDDGLTFTQMVPTTFTVIGVSKVAKSYEEDYLNATAGVMCKRGFAVVRRSGV